MPTAADTLVLWDIDHTLIETRGVGRAIYERAFSTATGKPLTTLATIAGRTELDIMRESLRINGIQPTDDAIQRLTTALINEYTASRTELATTGRALPGAHETLAAFAADPRIHHGVLTGNLRDIARIKLETFDLAHHLDLNTSAYGDDNPSRPELVHIAQQRATQHTGTTFTAERTVLIGDTPNDIHAALTTGTRHIAITTGKYTHNELHTHGATHILPALAPTMINLVLPHSS